MKTVTIFLDTIEKVKNFVNAINRLDDEFDLVSERYVINAKSIMGIFSLDLSKPLTLKINGEGELDDYIEDLKAFIVQ